MTVYVDDARHMYHSMIMCHMWADTEEELLKMADAMGLKRHWLQRPPKASWVHFDVSLSMKKAAIALGAQQTDNLGPVEHVAKLRGDHEKIASVQRLRQLRKTWDANQVKGG